MDDRFEITVEKEDAGTRMDAYLSSVTDNTLSRSFIQKLVAAGKVRVNGEVKEEKKYKVKAGDLLEMQIPEPVQTENALPEDIPLDIVYEDEDVAVINKPRGMVVHPAPGNETGTMVNALLYHFKDLSSVIAKIKNRNYRFIIFMDDLTFEDFEVEYKFLKAVIEGGVETKPENVLIYATSNRRHLIKESWNDRNDVVHINGMHKSDTMEEKLSLVSRFGVTISYSKPTPNEFYDIALGLAKRAGIRLSDEEIRAEANKWELAHGGISGRVARQFVDHLLSISADK